MSSSSEFSSRRIRAIICAAAVFCSPLATQPAVAEPPRLDVHQQNLLKTHIVPAYPFPSRFKWTVMQPSGAPMPLAAQKWEEGFIWKIHDRPFTVAQYLDRQPVTALLIARNGKLIFERYQYGSSQKSLFISNSMAKSFTGIAFGLLQSEGKLKDFREPAEAHVKALAGTLVGKAEIRNHLRMGSGIRYAETNLPGDDHERFGRIVRAEGILAALKTLEKTEHPPGEYFNYAGSSTAALSLVAQSAAGMKLAEYLSARLWRRIGAEHLAAWLEDPKGATMGHCCIFARARDYLRLGIILANDGARLDTNEQIIPRDFLIRTTTSRNLEPAFAPRPGSWGYENQFWVMGGRTRQFALLGLNGQHMFVNADLKLVMLQFAVNSSPIMTNTPMWREREAFWFGMVEHFARQAGR